MAVDALNIAHRGFSGKYLENTMTAFEEAYQAGATGIELDVQMTADGEVVIFHDASLKRLANTEGQIEEFTAKELSEITLFKGLNAHKIPTLDEYLTWFQYHDLVTNIELKSITSEDKGLEEKVIEKVYEYGQEEKVILSSFHKHSIIRSKEIDSMIECGLLTPSCSKKILHLTKEIGVSYIHPHYTSVNEEMIKEAEELELGVNVWSANSEESFRELENYSVFGIITDFPDTLGKVQKDSKVFS